MNGMVPIYGADGTLYYVTPEAALRSMQEGSGFPTDPTAIYSPEAAQQMAEFTAALQGEDVYTRRLQAMAQQYGAQTGQYNAVAQNAYNMGQLLMNASINNPYQYAQQAFGTDGSAPGFARALAQGFSYGDAQADPFDTSRLKGWDFGKTSAEQGPPQKSQGAPDYGGTPPAQAASSTPTTVGSTTYGNTPTGGSIVLNRNLPGDPASSPSAAAPAGGAVMGWGPSNAAGQRPTGVHRDAQGVTLSYGDGSAINYRPGSPVTADYDMRIKSDPTFGGWVGSGAPPSATAPVSSATTTAYSNTAPAGGVAPVYGALSGVSGHGSSDIAHVNKEHDLISQHGYGTGSDARSAAYAAAGMRQAEFNRLVKHGKDPFQRRMATGGIQVATHPQTVHVGEGGKDELLIALPLQRPGTAVPGFAAQIANDLHPQGNYVAHGGQEPPGLSYADWQNPDQFPPDSKWGVMPPSKVVHPARVTDPGGTFDPGTGGFTLSPEPMPRIGPELNRGRPVHLAQGGVVYGSGVNTLGIGNYKMSGSTPTPQGSVRVYANRGGMKTAPVTEGIMPAGMGDPTALDRIAANQFLARQYDSLLKASGYAGLDDYIARNQAARPQQRVQAGIGYRGY